MYGAVRSESASVASRQQAIAAAYDKLVQGADVSAVDVYTAAAVSFPHCSSEQANCRTAFDSLASSESATKWRAGSRRRYKALPDMCWHPLPLTGSHHEDGGERNCKREGGGHAKEV